MTAIAEMLYRYSLRGDYARAASLAAFAAENLRNTQPEETPSASSESSATESSTSTTIDDQTERRLLNRLRALQPPELSAEVGSLTRSIRIRPLPVDIDLIAALDEYRGDQTLEDAAGQAISEWITKRRTEEYLKHSDETDGPLTEAELEEGRRAWREA
ncbi:hypothetical protein ACFQ07_00560 [Actinomadura adrarensis]|uniref:CopG family transcriptional regulator n=1 Tax=Actinomadura adrarensis TaxID=1819600 RepID=A0ABW3C8D5_9ACTN